MRMTWNSLAGMVLAGTLTSGCAEHAPGPPTAPAGVLHARATTELAHDSVTALVALTEDAIGRLAPALGTEERPVLVAHLTSVADALAAGDAATARRDLVAAEHALEAVAPRATTDADLAALRLDVDALRSALGDNGSVR